MVINKEFTAICRGCGETFSLYNYVGLHPRSLMSPHFCGEKMHAYWQRHPRAFKSFDKLKEVKK